MPTTRLKLLGAPTIVLLLGCAERAASKNEDLPAATEAARGTPDTSLASTPSPMPVPAGQTAAAPATTSTVAGMHGSVAGQAGAATTVADSATVDAAPDSGVASADAGNAPTAPSEPIVCPATALAPGLASATLMHDGRVRDYLVYVPRSYDNTRPVPLVLNFHGSMMNAGWQRSFSGMDATADEKGFVIVYPQGVGDSWNAGTCCREAQSSNVDDVGFVRALLDAVKKSVCIDTHRIYSAGFSNGGRMSYRLGCELADVFAAIAPVAGTKSFPDEMNTPGCQPVLPVPLIDIMGSADPRVQAQPGQIAEWVAFNGCTDTSPTESYRQGQHFCSTYSQCKDGASVTYCVVDGGDHCWPGSYPCVLGNTSRPEEFSANDLIWKLFERSVR
jgi:polyhydroxybutyrate depolymerase